MSFPIKMVIFHSYVSLPEGKSILTTKKTGTLNLKTNLFPLRMNILPDTLVECGDSVHLESRVLIG